MRWGMNEHVCQECVEVAWFCFHRDMTQMATEEIVSKSKSFLDSLADRVNDFIPKNLSAWVVALTCLVVVVALSRLMSLQKSVSELQSRPSVDEHLVRQVVRQHLEETVRAMDQQNRLQLQLRQQQMMEQAKRAQQALAEKQKEIAAAPLPKIEILETGPAKEPVLLAPKLEDSKALESASSVAAELVPSSVIAPSPSPAVIAPSPPPAVNSPSPPPAPVTADIDAAAPAPATPRAETPKKREEDHVHEQTSGAVVSKKRTKSKPLAV